MELTDLTVGAAHLIGPCGRTDPALGHEDAVTAPIARRCVISRQTAIPVGSAFVGHPIAVVVHAVTGILEGEHLTLYTAVDLYAVDTP